MIEMLFNWFFYEHMPIFRFYNVSMYEIKRWPLLHLNPSKGYGCTLVLNCSYEYLLKQGEVDWFTIVGFYALILSCVDKNPSCYGVLVFPNWVLLFSHYIIYTYIHIKARIKEGNKTSDEDKYIWYLYLDAVLKYLILKSCNQKHQSLLVVMHTYNESIGFYRHAVGISQQFW